MYRYFYAPVLASLIVVVSQPLANAKSASEVQTIAQAVTVEIRLQENKTVGSGVIIQRQGNLYTLVTSRHVVCGTNYCDQIPVNERYQLKLADGQQYQAPPKMLRLLGSTLDLAIIQFRSDRNYPIAPVANSSDLKVGNNVYTSGFPAEDPIFNFNQGKVVAAVNQRMVGDGGGYTIIYDAYTLPGMSGGGVFDQNGYLVAVHGHGDRYKSGSITDTSADIGEKIGFNRGIPVRWLVQETRKIGIDLGGAATSNITAVAANSADQHFIIGFNKFIDPGDDVIAGKKKSIQEFTTAIRLNPRYVIAYLMRGLVYGQIREAEKALSDYNQVLTLDPNFGVIYGYRATIKFHQLNDAQGALADYNQVIALYPKSDLDYTSRGLLKYLKLNDPAGALADFAKAIALNPRAYTAYNNRGLLKKSQQNIAGAIADYNKAIEINPRFEMSYINRGLARRQLNDFKGAMADYDTAISLNPFSALAYHNRAFLKNKMDDWRGALADCNKAISLNPYLSNAYSLRSVLKYFNLNDQSGGLQDLRQAARLYRAEGRIQKFQECVKTMKDVYGVTEEP
jgi:tetratricopeptide (TPR) repeat protein